MNIERSEGAAVVVQKKDQWYEAAQQMKGRVATRKEYTVKGSWDIRTIKGSWVDFF